MGYDSDYYISISNNEIEKLEEKILEQHYHDPDEIDHTFCNDLKIIIHNTKWYTYKEELSKISNMFPGELITVERIGEDVKDYELSYFKDGLHQSLIGEIKYPEMDLTKFKKYERESY